MPRPELLGRSSDDPGRDGNRNGQPRVALKTLNGTVSLAPFPLPFPLKTAPTDIWINFPSLLAAGDPPVVPATRIILNPRAKKPR